MAILQSTNVVGTLCVNGVALGGGKNYKYACFTASDTWTPSSDLTTGDAIVEAIVIGAGGGGGGSALCVWQAGKLVVLGGGGGGGEIVWRDTPITSTAACTITIGAGGQTGSMAIASRTSATAVDSTAGGTTEGVGYTAYGGGGGATLGCTFSSAAGTRNCTTNIKGGPAGGGGTIDQTPGCCAILLGRHNSHGMSNSPLAMHQHRGYQFCFGGTTSTPYQPYATYTQQSAVSMSWANTFNASGSDDTVCLQKGGLGEPFVGINLNGHSEYPIHGMGGRAFSFGQQIPNMSQIPATGSVGYGRGGRGGAACNASYGTAYCADSVVTPEKGNSGIVVLRWYE